ncbi:GDP-L-fucose synthase [Candidatus Woesearchaeota archaeon]|nr:GDP-L-fucose synthase [Candidatus Woesearchaeota archaeon]
MTNFWSDKKVLVTGGYGFLGSHLVRLLNNLNPKSLFVPSVEECNLLNIDDIRNYLDKTKPDIVIHLAAKVGGMYFNKEKPAEIYYENLIMGLQLIHESHIHGVKKFVFVSTVAAYPKSVSLPFKEEDLWNGYPEETIASYGLAKRVILGQTQAYRKQYNFNAIYLILVNLYGPGNNFDPKNSFVIPSLIKKIDDAKKQGLTSITLWGSGNASRDFLYVGDGAKAIIKAAERYDKPDPINIGSGSEIKIKTIANNIREIIGYNGEIIWDISKPEGRRSSLMDISKAKKEIDFIPETSFEVGLRKTIDWYKFNSN